MLSGTGRQRQREEVDGNEREGDQRLGRSGVEKWKAGGSEQMRNPCFSEDRLQEAPGQPELSRSLPPASAPPLPFLCLQKDQDHILPPVTGDQRQSGETQGGERGLRFLSLDYVRTNQDRPPEPRRAQDAGLPWGHPSSHPTGGSDLLVSTLRRGLETAQVPQHPQRDSKGYPLSDFPPPSLPGFLLPEPLGGPGSTSRSGEGRVRAPMRVESQGGAWTVEPENASAGVGERWGELGDGWGGRAGARCFHGAVCLGPFDCSPCFAATAVRPRDTSLTALKTGCGAREEAALGQSPREHAFHAPKRPGRPVLRPQGWPCNASLEARNSAINCDPSKLGGWQRHFEEMGLRRKEN